MDKFNFKKFDIAYSDKNLGYIDKEGIYFPNKTEEIKIIANDLVALRVNNKLKKECIITKNDMVEIAICYEEPTRKMDLIIEKNDMLATLECIYNEGITYDIKKVSFENELKLQVVEVGIKKAMMYKPDEVIAFLRKHSIMFGIQYKEFQNILEGNKRGVIAKGLEKKDTVDDFIELQNHSSEQVGELEKVNYLDKNKINSVKEGETVGKIIKGTLGIEGKTIKGTIIPVRKIKELDLKLGEGVKQVGDTIVATIAGLPVYTEKNHKFEIKKSYEVPLNVDFKTGNVKFNGEVNIKGSVEENLSVYGAYAVNINGNVTLAKVSSLGNINIEGKILQSDIQCGFLENQYNKKKAMLEILKIDFKNLRADIEMILANNLLKDKKLGSVIKALLDSKYSRIIKFYDFIRNDIEPLFGDIDILSKIYEKKILRLAILNLKSMDEFNDILNVIEKYLNDMEVIFNLDSEVSIAYVQGSTINSKGSIHIKSAGVYVSNIVSDDSIIFLDCDTSLRGGHLKAKKKIKAPIVGTKSGVVTELEVEDLGEIECERAYFNTKFIIGKQSTILEYNYKNLKVFLDKDSNLVVEGLKF
ncbi:MAG: flagellar assembly protein A [Sarcina sp.]